MHRNVSGRSGEGKKASMQTMATQVGGFQAIFERKGVELGHPLRNRTTSSSRGTRTKWTKFSTRPNEILPF
jgi:hypothetical protein